MEWVAADEALCRIFCTISYCFCLRFLLSRKDLSSLVTHISILNVLSTKFNQELFIFSQLTLAERKLFKWICNLTFLICLAGACLSFCYILNFCMFSQPLQHLSSFQYFLNLQESSNRSYQSIFKLGKREVQDTDFHLKIEKCNLNNHCLQNEVTFVNQDTMQSFRIAIVLTLYLGFSIHYIPLFRIYISFYCFKRKKYYASTKCLSLHGPF